jgi:hypothetical protein
MQGLESYKSPAHLVVAMVVTLTVRSSHAELCVV